MLTKQLIDNPNEGYRPILKEISMIKGKHIVLACRKKILENVLNQAQQIGNEERINLSLIIIDPNWQVLSLRSKVGFLLT